MRGGKMITWGLGTLLAAGLAATAAAAHTGGGAAGGLGAGLLHPALGLDHLIAALAAGLWAGQLGGRTRVALPLCFLALTAAGLGLAVALPAPAAVELAILASLVLLGLLLAFEVRLSAGVAAILVGGFAVLHGHAHGSEVPAAASGLGFGAGVLTTTALLLAGGVALHGLLGRASARLAGALALLAGGALALTA